MFKGGSHTTEYPCFLCNCSNNLKGKKCHTVCLLSLCDNIPCPHWTMQKGVPLPPRQYLIKLHHEPVIMNREGSIDSMRKPELIAEDEKLKFVKTLTNKNIQVA